MKRLFVIFLIWLVVINVFALIGLNRLNLEPDTTYNWINPDRLEQDKDWNPIGLHARWDSEWYLDIAQNGYSFNGPGELSNIVFFPLYPLLMRLVALFTGGNFVLAGWILSSLFLLLGLSYLFKIVKEFHPRLNSHLPVLFLLIFPTAFFFNALYTESLFLFLSLATFYYGLKKNFRRAGIIGFLASLTRVTGVLLFIPLAWEYWKERDFNLKKCFCPSVIPLFFIPLGTSLFFGYHYLRFNDLLLFFKVESWWGRAFELNLEHLAASNPAALSNLALDVFFLVIALIATYLTFKKLRVSYGLYMLANLGVILSTGTLMSIGRYILVLFPIYILLASAKKEVQLSWGFVSILLLAMNVILFVNGYWAG